MSSPSQSSPQTVEWYLLANPNDLSVKINGEITVGEGIADTLVLESRVASERWLTLRLDDAGRLVVADIAAGWQLENEGEWVRQLGGTVCEADTVIELPHNELYLSHSMVRNEPAAWYRLQPSPLAKSINVAEPTEDTHARVLETEEPAFPDVSAENTEEIELTLPILTESLTESTKTEPATPRASSTSPPEKKSSARMLGVAAVLAIVAAVGYYVYLTLS